jgi:ankyrin repeat protein
VSATPELVERAIEMFSSAREGDVAALTSGIEAGIPVDLVDAEGNSYLMLAAYYGHAEAVAALLAAGANADRMNSAGQSPVAGAVFKRHREVVRLLVEAGADVDLGRPSAREMDVRMGGTGQF